MLDGCRPASPPSLRAHCGLRPDQADAGAVGVVVDLPGGREEASSMSRSVKKSGAPCGPYSTPISQTSAIRAARASPAATPARRIRARVVADVQHVAGAQRAPAVAAEAAERERRPRCRDSAARRSRRAPRGRRARRRPCDRAELERRARAHGDARATRGSGSPSSVAPHVGAASARSRASQLNAQRRPGQRDLERRRAVGVADEAVGEPERESSIGPDGGTPTAQ